MTPSDALPVLACVALFRSHLHGRILGEMTRFNQSKRVFNVPDWCFVLFSCPLCTGLHFAWIYRLCTEPETFLSLLTVAYCLACSLASFALHNLLSVIVHAANTLELLEATMINNLPKAIEEHKTEGDSV